MMNCSITDSLFLRVRYAVERVFQRYQENHKLVVTEADLQSWIFVELANDAEISRSEIHIHSQIDYINNDGFLACRPDIVLLPTGAYSVTSDGELYDRKGYTVYGDSIAIEIKFIRSHRNDDPVLKIKEDIDKLKAIRDRHYQCDKVYKFFAASVVLCRRRLSEFNVADLRATEAETGISLWLFNGLGD